MARLMHQQRQARPGRIQTAMSRLKRMTPPISSPIEIVPPWSTTEHATSGTRPATGEEISTYVVASPWWLFPYSAILNFLQR